MEITKTNIDGFVEVAVQGRLDAYWAEHLSKALEETIRQGDDRIRLNMREVEYISSMGIRVLITFYTKLLAIEGAFIVVNPSPSVEKILDMVGVKTSLMAEDAFAKAADTAEPAHTVTRGSLHMDVFPLASAAVAMTYRTIGDPSLLEGCRFTDRNCKTASFSDDVFGLGLGAFGGNFADCQDRFGEFLAVGGAAAYQPSDGSNSPDYLLAEGSYVPELQVLYAVTFQGGFHSLGRFETKGDARAVGLSTLAEAGLEMVQSDCAAMVVIAESAGLVGASLRKSPVNAPEPAALFTHPEIRDWLSFTTERAFSRALTVSVGVIARSPTGVLARHLRPLHGSGSVFGHVHAATFPYRPLKRGRIELRKTVRALFSQESVMGLLHLLGDDRGSSGVAESEFIRGACWVAPLTAAGA